MQGGKVCRVHGGTAPQTLAAAMRRLLAAADPAAARLIKIALAKETEPRDALIAIRDVLNRAGIKAPAEAPADAGQFLWEEFCAMHRRSEGTV